MTIFLFYCGIFIAMAIVESRRLSTIEDYYVAGRGASAVETGFSVAASSVGASATIGMCGLAYQVGLPAVWWLLSGALGLFVLSRFLLKAVRSQRALTMLELVRERLGSEAAAIAAVIILAAWTAILAAQFSAMGVMVEAMSGWGSAESLLFGAGFILFYTMLGGQGAVMKSDVLQFAVMAAGLAALLAALLLGDPHPLGHLRFELLNDAFGFGDWARFMLLIGGSFVVCPMLFTRFMSARSDRAARRGAVVGAAGLLFMAAVIVLIGIEAKALLAPGTPPDKVLALAAAELPGAMNVVFGLVMMSAILSSADSCLITAAAVATNDLLGKPGIGRSRLMMVLLSAAGLWLASGGRGVLELLLAANNMYVCAVVAPVFAALSAERPLHRRRAAAAMVLSGSIALAGEFTGEVLCSYAAMSASVVGTLLALDREPRRAAAPKKAAKA